MIKHLKSSVLDRKYLALRSIETAPIGADFSKMVVSKPWGNEYLLTNTPLVEAWHLFLDYHKSTSMHCHPNKKTALIVLDGKALFSYLNGAIELKPLDAIVIDAGVFHTTQCLSRKGLKLLEIETPPMKHDLIRLEDKYGRVNMGYEGIEQMRARNNSYISLVSNESRGKIKLGHSDISISFIPSRGDLYGQSKKPGIGVLISGFIKSKKKIIHTIGDIIDIRDLRNKKYNFQNISLLSIARKK